MRLSRIHTEQALTPGAEIQLDERAQHYASQVLRLRAGDAVVLFDGSGADYAARLTRCDRHGCRARVDAILREEPAALLDVHLALGISRGERMDFAIQKSVELGVAQITPLQTARGVVQLDAQRRDKRMAHWRGILLAACEQSGRSRVPVLHPPAELPAWLAAHRGGFLLHHESPLSLAHCADPGPKVHLLIGPEGGLTPDERELAGGHGFAAVRLGPRVLRTETAPLAALAAIQSLWGDFR